MSSDIPFELDITISEQVPMPDGYQPVDVNAAIRAILVAEQAAGSWDVSIAFCDDSELRRLHREFLADDTPTDIMTFPSDRDWLGEKTLRGGDIAISVDRAIEQSVDEGWSPARELLFLVAHGVLHLLGWDDSTPEDRTRMLDRQREILSSIP